MTLAKELIRLRGALRAIYRGTGRDMVALSLAKDCFLERLQEAPPASYASFKDTTWSMSMAEQV